MNIQNRIIELLDDFSVDITNIWFDGGCLWVYDCDDAEMIGELILHNVTSNFRFNSSS